MSMLRIESRDPLIFRDGRPNDGRSESRTLMFPPPSVLIGAVRTALGRTPQGFRSELIPELLKVQMRGPLLASETHLFAPAPGDALFFESEEKCELHALCPLAEAFPGQHSSVGQGRRLVGLPREQQTQERTQRKPWSDAPRFWRWDDLEAWLRAPEKRSVEEARGVAHRGVSGLMLEERIHVALGESGTAEDGALFGTDGVRFCYTKKGHQKPNPSETHPSKEAPPECDCREKDLRAREIDLACVAQLDIPVTLGGLPTGIRPLGGERRLASWSQEVSLELPTVPGWLLEHVRRVPQPLVRVVVLTPAFVHDSHAPRLLEQAGRSRIIAAKVDRPRTISGWDMTLNPPHGAPKKTRRLAAEGTVYWVQLSGDEDDRCRWVQERWMQNMSDDEGGLRQGEPGQFRKDGFGLAVLGIGEEETR